MPRTKYFDLKGIRFGKLFVQERGGTDVRGAVFWLCKCDCGEPTNVLTANLRNGSTKSCGCLRSEISSKKFKTHGQTNSPTYRVWSGMKTRCLNPKSTNYALYGGRGIKICERWGKFENFIADMGERPTDMSIDRIDVNGDYCPENCKWSSKKEQSQNRRKLKLINEHSLLKFLKTQEFLSEDDATKIIKNFFNQHQ